MHQVTNKAAEGERTGWAIDDPIVRLRVRGDDLCFELPSAPIDEWTIGAAADCDLRIGDPSGGVSRRHARLTRSAAVWTIHDLGSTNGIYQDRERRLSFQLAPGIEVEIGGVTLIAESARLMALREVLARTIGWDPQRRAEIDRALRAVREMATLRASLVLCGAGDLIEVVRRIHALALGAARPFVVCETEIRPVLKAAATGTLCMLGDKLPTDFAAAIEEITSVESKVRVVICCQTREDAMEAATRLGRTDVIEVPSIAERQHELDRLVREFAADAVHTLGADGTGFREHEMTWLRALGLGSLEEIEHVALRLVALRNWGVKGGATRLGITHAALSRWARRRKIPT